MVFARAELFEERFGRRGSEFSTDKHNQTINKLASCEPPNELLNQVMFVFNLRRM